MTPAHIAITLMVIVIWGMNFVAAKFALQVFPPLFLMALRFGAVGFALVWFAKRPTGMWRQFLVLSVTMGSLHFSLMFVALTEVSASIAAIAVQLQVPFAAILAAIFFKDMLGWRRALGMALAFAGVVAIAFDPEAEASLVHLLMVIAACFVWAIGNIQVKQLERIDGVTLNAWLSLLAAPQLLLVSLMLESGQIQAIRAAGLLEWGSLAYMAVLVTVVGYGLWYYMIDKYATNQTMPFTLLIPVVGVFGGVFVLGEPMTLQIGLGGLITVVGVAIIVLRRPKLGAPEV
jgi:O-acetylserine/cysteine efflux transporter